MYVNARRTSEMFDQIKYFECHVLYICVHDHRTMFNAQEYFLIVKSSKVWVWFVCVCMCGCLC